MRIKGKIDFWNDEKGYGFIVPDKGDLRVFVHITAFSNRYRRPEINQPVSYLLASDNQGRPRAIQVRFPGDSIPQIHIIIRRALFVFVVLIIVIPLLMQSRPDRPGSIESIPEQRHPATTNRIDTIESANVLQNAYNNHQSDLQVQGEGTVIRILSDDLQGFRHQRFILQLSTGQTLLIAHNIDLAPRINGLNMGDTVVFYGEYEWNEKGGVIHWTHHDPDGRHVNGWLLHDGRTYQ